MIAQSTQLNTWRSTDFVYNVGKEGGATGVRLDKKEGSCLGGGGGADLGRIGKTTQIL